MTDRTLRARKAALPELAILLVIFIAGCGTSPSGAPPAASDHLAGGWRVLERTGTAKVSSAGGSASVALEGQALPAAAALATGRSSQLIVAGDGIQAILGPATSLELPDDAGGQGRLKQDRGRVRYRVAAVPAAPLRIATPTGSAEIERGTVDVEIIGTVGRTLVALVDGEARVATLDGTRAATLRAGQSAELRHLDQQLALRRAPGAPLEPVVPVVLPAAAPRIEAAARTAADAGSAPAAPAGARSETRARAVAAVAGKPPQAMPPPPAAGNPAGGDVVPVSDDRRGSGRLLLLIATDEASRPAPLPPPAAPRATAPTPPSSAPPSAEASGRGASPVVDRVVVPARFRSSGARGRDDAGSAGSITPAAPAMRGVAPAGSTPDARPLDDYDRMTRGLLDDLDIQPRLQPMGPGR